MHNIFLKAASEGNIPELNRILNEGLFDVNYQNALGTTALWSAINNNQVEAVEFLIMRGADVNLINPHGGVYRTPLLTAFYGHNLLFPPAMTKLLLDQKADPNAQDSKLNTALHKVIHSCSMTFSEKYVSKIKLLLEAKADYTIKDQDGVSPLYLAKLLRPNWFIDGYQLIDKPDVHQLLLDCIEEQKKKEKSKP